MKERAKDNKVWESSECEIKVWVQEVFRQKCLFFSYKKSNLVKGVVSLEEAEAIHHAFAYFKNEKVI